MDPNVIAASVAIGIGGVIAVVLAMRPKPTQPEPETTPGPIQQPREETPEITELLRKADQLIAEGELDRAGVVLSQATTIDPERPGLLYVQARYRMERGELDAALRLLHQACALRPDVAAWHGVRAGLLLQAGHNERAADAYRAVLELEPGSEAAREGLELATRPA